jgi:hypothetical protein
VCDRSVIVRQGKNGGMTMRWWFNLFGGNQRAGAKAMPGLVSQISDPPPKDVVLPAALKELKDVYESAMVEAKERFDAESRRALQSLNKACAVGTSITERLESGLSGYLSTLARVKRHRWRHTLWFVGLLLICVVLDFVPTKLVMDSAFQSEIIEPVLCGGTSDCLIDRDLMLVMAVLAFLSVVMIIGHVAAVFAGGDYFDDIRTTVGWVVIASAVGVILALTVARFVHEQETSEDLYLKHLAGLQERLDEAKMGDPLSKSSETVVLTKQLDKLSSPEGKEKWLGLKRWRMISNASLFTILTVVVFFGAMWASLVHRYKDLDHLRRQRTVTRAYKKAVRALSRLDSCYQTFLNAVEDFRQSAQREVAEFCRGAEKEAANSGMEPGQWRLFMEVLKAVQTSFNTSLQLPGNIANPAKTSLPADDLDWGHHAAVQSFFDKLVLYDALEQGGRDAIDIGQEMPDSVLPRICPSPRAAPGARHACATDEEIKKKYQAGFKLGAALLAAETTH